MDMSLSKLQEIVKGQGRLACCSPWICKELDMTAQQQKVCHSFSSNEQASFNFMAVVTICSDIEAPKIKSATVPPSICHEVMGLDAMILVF